MLSGYLRLLCFCTLVIYVSCHNNGVARTPPMGWISWERFRCNTDCVNQPNTCISEQLYRDMADRLYEDGWLEHGYEFVNVDDCWSSKNRTSKKELQPDPVRFPSGIAALADYVHEKGLKLGIYGDMGTLTCGGYPGTMGYERIDARTFAKWGIDMLKLDGCYSYETQQAVGYPLMSKELNATGRPIVYSCSWPVYQGGLPPKVNYTLLGEICNLWRNYNDIDDSLEAVLKIIKWWGDNQNALIPAAGPGKWNDPDMLIGGDFSLSFEESKLQFGMWAILAAPLLVSADLRIVDEKIRDKIYFNKEVIRVNQDPLGIQGRRIRTDHMCQLWVRPLVGGQQAIAVITTEPYGQPTGFTFTLKELGIQNPAAKYMLIDIFDTDDSFKYNPDKSYTLTEPITTVINPNGITMFRAVPYKVSVTKLEVDILEFDLL